MIDGIPSGPGADEMLICLAALITLALVISMSFSGGQILWDIETTVGWGDGVVNTDLNWLLRISAILRGSFSNFPVPGIFKGPIFERAFLLLSAYFQIALGFMLIFSASYLSVFFWISWQICRSLEFISPSSAVILIWWGGRRYCRLRWPSRVTFF